MEHDAHLAENVDQPRPIAKIVTLVVLVAALFGGVAYVFFGPGI